jgi:hypothetical protein
MASDPMRRRSKGAHRFEELADPLSDVRCAGTGVCHFVALGRKAVVVVQEGWLGACEDGRDLFFPVRRDDKLRGNRSH